MTFSIRREADGDAAAIRAVHASAFRTDAEARLVDALRKAGRVSVSLVAAVEGQIVGHVLFTPVTPGRGLGLAPLAVLPRFQELGIGSELVESGLDACEGDYAVVLGDPAFYARFGFRRALDYGLDNEYGAREEFLVLELRPGGLDGVTGRVQYSPEFAVFQ